ncbi:hypothetical protein [Entomomonas asaccharolytica]|uniref:Uncharacterized protein n=1 Tax=Entomomonas asaccharolytica TaxID=2785331 RepID=A0A974NDJ7_9GAMM|nr:hypothetical protein [Entomomonas asaccharolytica]QQP84706.1 hypothetical protein JHT90_09830 [Entomomonas asaccharolytica]
MKRFLITCFLCSLVLMVKANEQCQIKPIPTEYKTVNNKFLFKNRLAPDLIVYTANPESTIISGDPILIFSDKKSIGFQQINESFGNEQEIPKLLKEKWDIDCSNAITEIRKSNYQLLIANDGKTLEGLSRTTVFIIPKNKKFTDYFYLLSFIGYTDEEVVEMLIKDE